MSEAERIAQWLEQFSKIHGIKADIWYDITNDITLTYKKMDAIKQQIDEFKVYDNACVSMAKIQSIVEKP